MSDSNSDARKHRADVSHYAPRHHRLPPDEAAVLPMLERLSRGESDRASHARKPDSVPPAEPIRASRREPAGPRLPLSATGRIAVALGVVVAVTAASAAVLRSREERPAATKTAKAPPAKQAKAKDQARVEATEMPRPVHTVTIRPQATPAPTTPNMSPQDSQPETSSVDTAQALPAPLKTWAMFPDSALASGSAATDGAKVDDAKKLEDAKKSEPANTKGEPGKVAARHKVKAKRTARRHRRHRILHHRVRTAAKPQPVQQAQAALPAPPITTEPIKKTPVQAAIDFILGNDGGDGGASGSSGAPMTTGTAFQ